MTNEEAKKIFLNRGYVEVPGGTYYDADKWRESITVISKWLEQEPCEKAVSLQAVKDIICSGVSIDTDADKEYVCELIDKLPSVTPKEKTGKWIEIKNSRGTTIALRCSCCGNSPKHGISSDFCPNCGCRMINRKE